MIHYREAHDTTFLLEFAILDIQYLLQNYVKSEARVS